jgi:hypothetical protein
MKRNAQCPHQVRLERAAEQLVQVNTAVHVTHAELVPVCVEQELGYLGRGLVRLFERGERVV